jgi:tRNA 2-thiouridine synthesizing protein A
VSEPGVLDARGLRCPAPVLALARRARQLPTGAVVAVWWTDPAARHDIPAWARMRGHEVLTTRPLGPAEAGRDEDPTDGPGPDAPQAHVTEVRLGTGPVAG